MKKVVYIVSTRVGKKKEIKEKMERGGYVIHDMELYIPSYPEKAWQFVERMHDEGKEIMIDDGHDISFYEEYQGCIEKVSTVYRVLMEDEEPPTKEYIIMLGLNDKDTHSQLMDTNEYIGIVGRFLCDCTITVCHGFYNGEHENTLKVEWYTTDDKETVEGIVEMLAGAFNQECAVLKDGTGEVMFIYPEYADNAQVIGA